MFVRSLFILICSIILFSCGKNSKDLSSIPSTTSSPDRIGGSTSTTVTTAKTTTTVTATTITQPELQVTGLAHETTPKNSKTWNWNCTNNSGACAYRYAINQSQTHDFSSRDLYGNFTTAAKSITSASQNGTYYLHVQAKDSNNNESDVKTVLVILEISITGNLVEVVGLEDEEKAKQFKNWVWSCQENQKAVECLYRYDINNKDTHTFDTSAEYKDKSTATAKDLKDGKYYIHVQAKSKTSNQESSVKNASVILDNTPPDAPVTDSFQVPASSDEAAIEIIFKHNEIIKGDQIQIYVEGGSNSKSSGFLQSIFSFFSSNTNPDICVEESRF